MQNNFKKQNRVVPGKIMPKDPISTLSSMIFPAAGIVIGVISCDVYTAVSLALLGLASAGFHWIGKRGSFWHRADEFMIYVSLHAVIVQIFNGHPIAILAGIAVLVFMVSNLDDTAVNTFAIVPLAMLIGIAGLWFDHGYIPAIVVFAVSLLAGFVRVIIQPRLPIKYVDLSHSIWHFLAAGDFVVAWYFAQ